MACWATTPKCLISWLVGAEGFEPPAPCSQSRCSTRLSYAPTVGLFSPTVGRNAMRCPAAGRTSPSYLLLRTAVGSLARTTP